MKKYLLITTLVLWGRCFAQSVAINTDGSAASSSSLLEVKSTTKGLLIPRMNKTQRNAIAAPVNGLMVYVNAPDTVGFSFYNGTAWKWLEEKNSNSWSLQGNAGTSPFSNLVGTTDATDLALGANSIPRMWVTNEAEVGIGLFDPHYGLDVTTGNAAINNCSFNGIRVKTVAAGFDNLCEKGLFMGYSNVPIASNEGILWNYGQSNTGIKSLSFGVGPVLTMMRLNSDGLAGIGSGNMQPKYALDVNVGIAAVNPCGRNGIRLNTLQFIDNPCENGFFIGYDNSSNINSTSLWNFSADNASTNRFIRFGFGTDFSESPIGESMRILPPGKGIGINQLNPQAMLHITNYSGGGVIPGVMVTNPTLPPGSSGFFSGLRYISGEENTGYVWNFQNAPIRFGTNDVERMVIKQSGDVGIGTNLPGTYGHGGTNRIVEISNDAAAGANIQSHVILSSTGNSGSLGGITWASTGLSGEKRTGFIGNAYETAEQTKLSFYNRDNAGALAELYIQGDGNAWLQGTLTQASDARLKTNIHHISNPLEKLNQISGYTYNWINQQRDDETQMGVLAQEVQTVFPDLVKTNSNGNLSVNYSGLIPVLIEAVKEQQKQISEQQKMIEQLLKK